MDVHGAWVRGKSISEIARQTGRDRKTICRLVQVGAPAQPRPRHTNSKLDPVASTCSRARSARIQ